MRRASYVVGVVAALGVAALAVAQTGGGEARERIMAAAYELFSTRGVRAVGDPAISGTPRGPERIGTAVCRPPAGAGKFWTTGPPTPDNPNRPAARAAGTKYHAVDGLTTLKIIGLRP